MLNIKNNDYSTLILRIGVSGLFLWFGFSQVLAPSAWVGWVPDWAINLFNTSNYYLVLFNGSFEVIGGVLIAFGILPRLVSLILGLHLLLIVVDIGLTAIGIRDIAIAIATLALAAAPLDKYGVSYNLKLRKEGLGSLNSNL